jgi:ribosomal protein L29
MSKENENMDLGNETKDQNQDQVLQETVEENTSKSKKEEAIENIREVRRRMDRVLTVMNEENNKSRSRELSLACTSFQLSRMWFGKALITLGEAGYKNDGKRKDVKDIEPPSDKAKEFNGELPSNRVEFLDYLRETIRDITSNIKEISKSIAFGPYVLDNTVENLTEAVMWLGADLGRLYEENKQKK